MTCSGLGVWLSSQGSSKISLFHGTTYEHLLDVNIAQTVAHKLQGKFICMASKMSLYQSVTEIDTNYNCASRFARACQITNTMYKPFIKKYSESELKIHLATGPCTFCDVALVEVLSVHRRVSIHQKHVI